MIMALHWNTNVWPLGPRTADYYHTAPTSERDRIQSWGLQPGNSQLNGMWQLQDAGFTPEDAMRQVRHRTKEPGVFMAQNPEDAYSGRPGENDVWRVNPSYLDEDQMESDPSWDNARTSPNEVPPEALSLHQPAEEQMWDMRPTSRWKIADAGTTFNPVAPIDELTNYLNEGAGGSAAGALNPNNPLSTDADPMANTANPNMNPSNPGAFNNPSNPTLNADLPGAATNTANPQFNRAMPGAQNNPANQQYNPAIPGAINNESNPSLNPAYPGSWTNPASPMHNPDYPNPEAIGQKPESIGPDASFPPQVQARVWEPLVKHAWTPSADGAGDVPDEGDAVGGSVVAEMDNLTTHLQDGRALPLEEAQALREACLRLASALDPQPAPTWEFKHEWSPFDRLAADLPGGELGDSKDWPDPTEPRSAEPPAPQGCTCAEGQKLTCPVHGLHPTETDMDHSWSIPESNPVGYPQGSPRGWATPY